MSALSAGRYGDQSERAAIRDTTDRLDEAAWDLQERADEGPSSKDEYLNAFKRARASAAVWFAFDVDAKAAAMESVYEANAAVGSMSPIREKVASVVGHSK